MSFSDLVIPQRLRRGLVAYWPLADASAVDLRSALHDGRGTHDLTNVNDVTRANGPSDNLPNAADFDGADQQLTHASVPSFRASRGLSVAAWARINDGSLSENNPHAAVIAKQDDGNDNEPTNLEWHLRLAGNAPDLGWAFAARDAGSNTRGVEVGVVAEEERWYFVAAGYDGSRLWISVDGAAKIYGSDTGIVITPANGLLRIGFRRDPGGNSYFWDGQIAHVGLWARDLTQDEVFWLHNDGQGRDLLRGV